MPQQVRIGTRDSALALWQATTVSQLLASNKVSTELVPVKSEGDIDLTTPLYAMGVQGIFTRSLDIALLNKKIDVAVHSMKDVPVALPKGIVQAAVLPRANHKDLFVFKNEAAAALLQDNNHPFTIATSSVRRRAQWLNRYPNSIIENLRGNVNTRLAKLQNSEWTGAIFAAAGLERIGLRPDNSIELDWMLPAPAQGAIMVVCREEDTAVREACALLNDEHTAICVEQERVFLQTLMGGCTAPISALTAIENDVINFEGSLLSVDGKEKLTVSMKLPVEQALEIGKNAALQILNAGGDKLMQSIRNIGE